MCSKYEQGREDLRGKREQQREYEKGLADLTEECPWRKKMTKELSITTSLR